MKRAPRNWLNHLSDFSDLASWAALALLLSNKPQIPEPAQLEATAEVETPRKKIRKLITRITPIDSPDEEPEPLEEKLEQKKSINEIIAACIEDMDYTCYVSDLQSHCFPDFNFSKHQPAVNFAVLNSQGGNALPHLSLFIGTQNLIKFNPKDLDEEEFCNQIEGNVMQFREGCWQTSRNDLEACKAYQATWDRYSQQGSRIQELISQQDPNCDDIKVSLNAPTLFGNGIIPSYLYLSSASCGPLGSWDLTSEKHESQDSGDTGSDFDTNSPLNDSADTGEEALYDSGDTGDTGATDSAEWSDLFWD